MAADLELTKTQLRGGVWEGVLTTMAGDDAQEPVLTFRHNGDALPGLSLTPAEPGSWHVRVAIPAERIGDDLQVFTITGPDETTVLAQIVVFTGETVDDDLRSDVALLRAELDLLKRAFRKHYSDTA